MFNKNSDGQSSRHGASSTVIAHGVKVEGNFSSQSDVLIEGDVDGNVATSGSLTVGPQARLKADIKAEKAVIAGSVEGSVHIGSHLEIKATARLLGDITCQTASLESGASLNGKVIIGKSPSGLPQAVARSIETKKTKVES